MKKIVISGSAKLQTEINKWKNIFENTGYEVLDYPKKIDEQSFIDVYPTVHKNFFENIAQTDILFILNEDKNEKSGYIGPQTFSELNFGLAQKFVYNKDIQIILLKMPGEDVQCSEEINLYLKLGWIKLYKKNLGGIF